MNFKEYWKQNEALYTQLGVSEAAAYKIWCDAVTMVKVYMLEGIQDIRYSTNKSK